jgi:subtilisin family serine protease
MDGYWDDPSDPVHTLPTELPDSTRLAMDYAISNGRNGKGCVIVFAAGNGNEDIKFDGYASYDKVLAVAACNDTNKRSVYSDYGDNVWCSFPSSDFGHPPYNHPSPLTSGIYTTDRQGGAGYNIDGDYTEKFGGTSSACPGVAGVIALMLSVNPDLTIQQVKDIIKETSEKIDIPNGKYDVQNHSKYYGYGKVDAEKAVKKSLELNQNVPENKVKIISALVNPKGPDRGNENISILNTSTIKVDLKDWSIEVKGRKEQLDGTLAGGEAKTISLQGKSIRLSNTGASINLMNSRSEIVHFVSYKKKHVKEGIIIEF